MTPNERAELRSLCDRVTAGPWRTDCNEIVSENGESIGRLQRWFDVVFAAQSRTALPALLDYVERLEEDMTILQVNFQAMSERCERLIADAKQLEKEKA